VAGEISGSRAPRGQAPAADSGRGLGSPPGVRFSGQPDLAAPIRMTRLTARTEGHFQGVGRDQDLHARVAAGGRAVVVISHGWVTARAARSRACTRWSTRTGWRP